MQEQVTYVLLGEPEETAALGSWQPHLGSFTEVVGYTALGCLFLRDPSTSTYLVLHPMQMGNNAKHYGPFSSIRGFESAVLHDSELLANCLQPTKVQALAARLGPLGPGQVFIPAPYPMLGGSGELDTYHKGLVWVFADLVGQTLGL